jgi:hypothetical protein
VIYIAVLVMGNEQLRVTRVTHLNLILPLTLTSRSERRAMDAYPSELLSHLNPLMFVAGLPLDKQPGPSSDPSPSAEQLPASTEHGPFAALTQSLVDVFTARKGFHIWDMSRGSMCDFHVVLVDKVRFSFELWFSWPSGLIGLVRISTSASLLERHAPRPTALHRSERIHPSPLSHPTRLSTPTGSWLPSGFASIGI